MDSRLDIERDKYAEYREQQHEAMKTYCYRDCDCHDEGCPYYDIAEETWDYEQCFKDGDF